MRPKLVTVKRINNGVEYEELCAIGEFDENDPDHEVIDPSIYFWFESQEELDNSLGEETWDGDTFVSYVLHSTETTGD